MSEIVPIETTDYVMRPYRSVFEFTVQVVYNRANSVPLRGYRDPLPTEEARMKAFQKKYCINCPNESRCRQELRWFGGGVREDEQTGKRWIVSHYGVGAIITPSVIQRFINRFRDPSSRYEKQIEQAKCLKNCTRKLMWD